MVRAIFVDFAFFAAKSIALSFDNRAKLSIPQPKTITPLGSLPNSSNSRWFSHKEQEMQECFLLSLLFLLYFVAEINRSLRGIASHR